MRSPLTRPHPIPSPTTDLAPAAGPSAGRDLTVIREPAIMPYATRTPAITPYATRTPAITPYATRTPAMDAGRTHAPGPHRMTVPGVAGTRIPALTSVGEAK
ncbi:hypothetical protein ACIBG4_26235 [Nonomuraea sp. NPDC050383]|uniref:hypothetical protein n=1 Tax=Nonomuraea sp. NPDC050383 TaxID=3364362 RepID=UPI0037AB28DD